MSIEVGKELVGVSLSSIKLGSKQAPYMQNLPADCSLRNSLMEPRLSVSS